MPLHRTLPAALLILFLCGLPGCGGKPTKRPPNSAPAYLTTGVVTVDGQPLTDATVVFRSDSGGAAAAGRTDASGKFRLTTYDDGDGAVAGPHTIMVARFEMPPPPPGYNPDTGAPLPPPKLTSPQRYSDFDRSGLTTTILENTENFVELKLDK